MKAYLVTSPKFTGTAELLYNADGVLCRIDTTNTDMDATNVQLFKHAVAPMLSLLTSKFSPDTLFVESSFKVTFEMWFNKYGYKVDKKRAEKVWNTKSEADYVEAWFSVEPYERFLKRKGGKIEKMYPKTYLSSEAYKTEWDKIK